MNRSFKSGDHLTQCDICGRARYASDCKKTWDGFMACTVSDCWYPKHEYDDPIPVRQDSIPVQDARPRPTGLSVSFGSVAKWNTARYDGSMTWNDDEADNNKWNEI